VVGIRGLIEIGISMKADDRNLVGSWQRVEVSETGVEI
jgi:hypothetical protein